LNLLGVEVKCNHTIGAGDGDQVGDQASRDGHAWLILFVAAAVGVVRDDGGDTVGRGALAGIEHDQEFHDMVVDGR
jgi:hypothetical protein